MNSQNFLKEKLNNLTILFPGIKVKYEIKNRSFTKHIIEISPVNVYEDKTYMDVESDLSFEFERLFPSEEIMFVSENSLVRVDNPILTFGLFDFSFEIKQEEGLLTNFLSNFLGTYTKTFVFFDTEKSILEAENNSAYKSNLGYKSAEPVKAGNNYDYALAA